ncbi:acyltransferase family protein [Nocardioides sp. GXZ039]|uniref:acyltransferase family protein n=1 Tax=Nocardioides sp. GXZ039 TaxID=3136018 RepID=UPI0030F4AFAF
MARRDPWFDNAKMALIVLVVIGHLWSLLPAATTGTAAGTNTNAWLYDWLYMWHMPAFVLLSGYLSRSFTWTRERLSSVVTTLLVPYVIFQVGLSTMQWCLGWGWPERVLLDPVWPLWYLLALAAWRLVTPVFRRLPGWLALSLAVVISLYGGTLDVEAFSIPRILGMLPFFVLGLVATPEAIAAIRTHAMRFFSVGCLILALVVTRRLDDWAGTYWLYLRPYEILESTTREGVEIRATLLLLSLGCALGALSLVPGTDGWFARLGTATMVVFLLHGVVIRGLDAGGVMHWTVGHDGLGRVFVVLLGIAISLALAAPPTVRRVGWLVDPVGWAREEVRRAVELSMVVRDGCSDVVPERERVH